MFGPYNTSFFIVKIYDFIEDFVCLVIKYIAGARKRNVRNINRILVSNVVHLGDVLYTLRVVSLLKKQYPQAKIDMICGSWCVPLVENCADINEYHVYDSWKMNRKKISLAKKFYHSVKTFFECLQSVKKKQYDLAIDFFTMCPSMADLFYLAGIPKRIGYTTAGGSVLFTDKLKWRRDNRHIIQMQAACLEKLGLDISDLPNSVVNINTASDDETVLKNHGLESGKYYVFHYGSGEITREWNLKNWIELLNRLSKNNIKIVLTGAGAREKSIIDDIIAGTSNNNAISLCNQLSIAELMQIISHADLFIGCESFAGHIAAMYKVKQISIMHGASKKSLWQPYGNSNCIVVRNHLKCLECQAPRKCRNGHECMKISVDDVYDSLDKIIKNNEDI